MLFTPIQGYLMDRSKRGSMVSERQWLPERLLPIVELSRHGRDLAAHGSQANKQRGGGTGFAPLSAPHGFIRGLYKELD